jgi:GMP synthase (glutamine-hydrolysing)
VLVLEEGLADAGIHERAGHLINKTQGINRVVALAASHTPISKWTTAASWIDATRLDRLRRADGIVRRLCKETGFEQHVWQFPVVLVPLGAEQWPDSVVLRPIHSVDGMTARAVSIPPDLLVRLCRELLEIDGVNAVLLDLTHKPPGTIEWE